MSGFFIVTDVQGTFDHFMKVYWNQMGPEVYGDFVTAVNMANAHERGIYSKNLCKAFRLILSELMCADSAEIAMKDDRLWNFWRAYDFVISKNQCNIGISILELR